jgi:hypothetical protein
MPNGYMNYLGWGDATDGKPTCIQFEDGNTIYRASDAAKNKYGNLRSYDEDCKDTETYEYVFID